MRNFIFIMMLKIRLIMLVFCMFAAQTNLNAAMINATFSWTGSGGYRAAGFLFHWKYNCVTINQIIKIMHL